METVSFTCNYNIQLDEITFLKLAKHCDESGLIISMFPISNNRRKIMITGPVDSRQIAVLRSYLTLMAEIL